MEYDSQVYLLSEQFVANYPPDRYPEIMHKQGRPYACLLIDTHDGFFICVPFRSSISHSNAFLFTGTERSKRSRSGLDYSKIAIIKNCDYIDLQTAAVVDQDEYNELKQHLTRIVCMLIHISPISTDPHHCIRESTQGNISIPHCHISMTF